MDIAEVVGKGDVEAGVGALQAATFLIHGVRCQKCVAKIQDALAHAPAIEQASVDPDRRFLRVRHHLDDPLPSINAHLATIGDYNIEAVAPWRVALTHVAHYRPLLIMAAIVLCFVGIRQTIAGWHGHGVMADMMAGYFLLFGLLKMINRKAFATSYARYDWLASRSAIYASVYPLIELGLGIGYLVEPGSIVLNLATMLLMSQKGWSVHQALCRNFVTQCACLGGLFSIPISRVTVFEDALMAAMAAAMLVGIG